MYTPTTIRITIDSRRCWAFAPRSVGAVRGTSTMRETQATLAKLTRPKLVAVVARDRLYQLLDDRLAHPTVWVTGPPGAGKTTLLSGYAESRKRLTLWYQLDGGDADVATLFHYLRIAERALASRRHAGALPALTPEYLPDLIGFTRRFFRQLFARLPRPSLLALDDYQEVPPGSPLHGVMACALAELPEGVRLCGGQPRRATAGMCAPGCEPVDRLARLGRAAPDEAGDGSDRTYPASDRRIRYRGSHQRSDGWVAGLISVARPTSESSRDPCVLPCAIVAIAFQLLRRHFP